MTTHSVTRFLATTPNMFFFTGPATTDIYTLSLHDALPISFAGDVLAGVAFLKGRSEIDPEKIGLIGHSEGDRKSTRLNSSHVSISYAVFCLKKKKEKAVETPARYDGTRERHRNTSGAESSK